MSQSIKSIGHVLNEHCERDNHDYQVGVALTEEESRNTIIKHVRAY